MKKLPLILVAVALFVALSAYFPVHAETPKAKAAPTIAIVNMDLVLKKSTAGKHLQEQLKKKRNSYLGQLKKKHEKLNASKKNILKDKEKMGADAFKAKQGEFQKQVLNVGNEEVAERRKIEESVEKGFKKLRLKSADIVREIAKQRGIAVVLSHKQVVMAASSLDITDEVLSRLNKEMKTLPIKWQ